LGLATNSSTAQSFSWFSPSRTFEGRAGCSPSNVQAFTVSQPLLWAFDYSVTAPALLYLLHPCSRMPSADLAMDGLYEENAGAIFFLLFNHQQGLPN